MHARVVAPLVLATVIAITGTAAAATTTVTVRDRSISRSVALTKGSQLKIVLANNNPSTGYHWVYATRPSPKVLKLVSDHVKSPAPDTGMPPVVVGAPQPRTIVYRARAIGSTSIRMRLLPPGSSKTAQTLTLRVRVTR